MLVTDQDVDLPILAGAIEEDPVITGRLLSIANSAYYAPSTPVSTVSKAIIEVLGVRMVKALTSIEDFNEHFKTSFSEKEFDTIGGIVVQHFGRVPECDEAITIKKWRFKIVNGNARRINLMEVTPIS